MSTDPYSKGTAKASKAGILKFILQRLRQSATLSSTTPPHQKHITVMNSVYADKFI
jgi:hypothetical protein